MTPPTVRGPRPGHDRLQPRRLDHEVYALAATSDAAILFGGITDRATFAAVLSRANKSEALLGELTTYAIDDAYRNRDAHTATVMSLLGAPDLYSGDLAAVAAFLRFHGHVHTSLLMAVCTHPNVAVGTLISMTWRATDQQCAEVSKATASVLSAVVAWVRARSGELATVGREPTDYQVGVVCDTRDRWAGWVGADQGRRSFLQARASDFTDEADLFAAGEALLAAPVRA